jgi:hypothetical protein
MRFYQELYQTKENKRGQTEQELLNSVTENILKLLRLKGTHELIIEVEKYGTVIEIDISCKVTGIKID